MTPARTREMLTLKEPRRPGSLCSSSCFGRQGPLRLQRAGPSAARAPLNVPEEATASARGWRTPRPRRGGGGGGVLAGLRAGASEGLRRSSAEPAWRTRSSPVPGAGPRVTAMPVWPELCRLRGAATW